MSRDNYNKSRKGRYSPDHIRYPSSLREKADKTFGTFQDRLNNKKLSQKKRIISIQPAPQRRTRIISVQPAPIKTKKKRIISVTTSKTQTNKSGGKKKIKKYLVN